VNNSTLEKFKKRLVSERERLIDHLGSLKIDSETGGDEADEASKLSNQHVVLRFRERDLAAIREINRALTRIKEGEYGECSACGEDVGVKRLTIRPTATLCVVCQETEERRDRVFFKSSTLEN
jgi:DnaK suppressor protein